MHPVQHPGGQEPRHRPATALDEDPSQTQPGQAVQHRQGLEAAVADGQLQHPHRRGHPTERRRPAETHDPRGRLPVRQHPHLPRRPPRGVQHHPVRALTLDGADREPRVVGHHGAHPDEDRVHEAAQLVQVGPVEVARDVGGVAGAGGDATVQALAQLRDGVAGVAEQRGVQRRSARGVPQRPGAPHACIRGTRPSASPYPSPVRRSRSVIRERDWASTVAPDSPSGTSKVEDRSARAVISRRSSGC